MKRKKLKLALTGAVCATTLLLQNFFPYAVLASEMSSDEEQAALTTETQTSEDLKVDLEPIESTEESEDTSVTEETDESSTVLEESVETTETISTESVPKETEPSETAQEETTPTETSEETTVETTVATETTPTETVPVETEPKETVVETTVEETAAFETEVTEQSSEEKVVTADSLTELVDSAADYKNRIIVDTTKDLADKMPSEIKYEGTSYENTYILSFSGKADYNKALEFLDTNNYVYSLDGQIKMCGSGDIVKDQPLNKSGKKIAIIDTGSNNANETLSVIGDSGKDDNGHGTLMSNLILANSSKAYIVSIKALDENGNGKVVDVYNAIQVALDNKADYILLALSIKDKEDSYEAFKNLIADATKQGVTIISAAGNNNKDASEYIPAKIPGVITVGALNNDLTKLKSSNYGKDVDYYVPSNATSEAAAVFSGLLIDGKTEGIYTSYLQADMDEKPIEEDTDKKNEVTIQANANAYYASVSNLEIDTESALSGNAAADTAMKNGIRNNVKSALENNGLTGVSVEVFEKNNNVWVRVSATTDDLTSGAKYYKAIYALKSNNFGYKAAGQAIAKALNNSLVSKISGSSTYIVDSAGIVRTVVGSNKNSSTLKNKTYKSVVNGSTSNKTFDSRKILHYCTDPGHNITAGFDAGTWSELTDSQCNSYYGYSEKQMAMNLQKTDSTRDGSSIWSRHTIQSLIWSKLIANGKTNLSISGGGSGFKVANYSAPSLPTEAMFTKTSNKGTKKVTFTRSSTNYKSGATFDSAEAGKTYYFTAPDDISLSTKNYTVKSSNTNVAEVAIVNSTTHPNSIRITISDSATASQIKKLTITLTSDDGVMPYKYTVTENYGVYMYNAGGNNQNRIGGFYEREISGYDVEWVLNFEAQPKLQLSVTKVSAASGLTFNNSAYDLSGTIYKLYDELELAEAKGNNQLASFNCTHVEGNEPHRSYPVKNDNSRYYFEIETNTDYYLVETKAGNGFMIDSTIYRIKAAKTNGEWRLYVRGVNSVTGKNYSDYHDDGSTGASTNANGYYKGFDPETTNNKVDMRFEDPPARFINLKKESTNPSVSNGSSDFDLDGTQYKLYIDEALTQEAYTFDVDSSGSSGTYLIGSAIIDGQSGGNVTYYLKETAVGPGFIMDRNTYRINIGYNNYSGALTASAIKIAGDTPDNVSASVNGNTIILNAKDIPEVNISMLKVASTNNSAIVQNNCYSLSGTKYGIYSNAQCTDLLHTFEMDDEGKSVGVDSKFNIGDRTVLYIRETAAGKGFTLDRVVYRVEINHNTNWMECFNHYTDERVDYGPLIEGTYYIQLSDIPVADPINFNLKKQNPVSNALVNIGSDSLKSAKFEMLYYADDYALNQNLSGINPTHRTEFTLDQGTSISSGTYRMNMNRLAAIDTYWDDVQTALYQSGLRGTDFPLGTYVIHEIQAPKGFALATEGIRIKIALNSDRSSATKSIVYEKTGVATNNPVFISGALDGDDINITEDNLPVTGFLSLTKSISDKSVTADLSKFRFNLYSDNTLVATGVANASTGVVTWTYSVSGLRSAKNNAVLSGTTTKLELPVYKDNGVTKHNYQVRETIITTPSIENSQAAYTYAIPSGWHLSTDNKYFYKNVQLSENGEYVSTITNVPIEGSFAIRKTENAAKADKTFTFDIYFRGNGATAANIGDTSDKNLFRTVSVTTTNGSGETIVSKVPEGWYEVIERKATGYIGSWEGNAATNTEKGKLVHIDSSNRTISNPGVNDGLSFNGILAKNEINVDVNVIKKDSWTNEIITTADKHPSGVYLTFELYNDANGNGKLDKAEKDAGAIDKVSDTDENAKVTFKNVRKGSYIVHETATVNGYYLSSDDVAVTVEDSFNLDQNFSNVPYSANVVIYKVDSKDNKWLLSGACFEIYNDVNGNGKYDKGTDTAVKSYVDGELRNVVIREKLNSKGEPIYVPMAEVNGTYKECQLHFGSYVVVETYAPENHKMVGDTEVPFTIEAKDTTVAGFKVEEIQKSLANDQDFKTKVSTLEQGKKYEKSYVYTEKGTINDTVAYTNLIVGQEYTMEGKLVGIDDSGKENDLGITNKVRFTPKADGSEVLAPDGTYRISGTVTVPFTVNTTKLVKYKKIVAEEVEYKELNGKRIKVGIHYDINDDSQTIIIPKLKTTATDAVTNSKNITYGESIVLKDVVSYENLLDGVSYNVTGRLMDKTTGKEVLNKDGKPITGSTTFKVDKKAAGVTSKTAADGFTYVSGKVEVKFTFDSKDLAGKTLVVFERVTLSEGNKDVVAVHEDIDDEDQTVFVPEIGTKARSGETGEQVMVYSETATLIDTVSYNNLIVGRTYTVSGRVMDKATGEVLKDSDGKDITASTEFKPEKSEGTVDVVFTFDTTVLEGRKLVVFEDLYYESKMISKHEDIDDEGQTVYVPDIHTTAKSGETLGRTMVYSETATLVDTVSYSNLVPGITYKVTGTIMDKATNEVLTDEDGNAITAEAEFVPESSEGSVDVTFTFDTTICTGKKLVVFERVFYGKDLVAVHTDINDENQTVETPEIGTKAESADTSTKTMAYSKKAVLKDTVSYKNLEVGKKYKLSGTVMDQETEKPLKDADGKKVTAETEFTAESTEGTVELKFTVDTTALEGKTLVVFENMYYENKLIAIHADIDDEDQTVYVPSASTIAKTEDGKKTISSTVEKATVVDTISYTGLTPGKKYKAEARLYLSTGEQLKVNGNEILSIKEFKPEDADGTVDVTISFPTDGLKSGDVVVVFEKIYDVAEKSEKSSGSQDEDILIAHHEDLTDTDQSITFKVPATGEIVPDYAKYGIATLVSLAVGALVFYIQKKRKLEI